MTGDNAARPRPGDRLVRVQDLPDPGAVAIDFRTDAQIFSLIAARRGAVIRLYENVCPHAHLPLERPDGRVVLVDGLYLVCSAHGASFRLDDGACAGGPATKGLITMAFDLEDGWIVAR